MAKIRHLAQGTALPEWFLDLFQEEMTGYASANFAVTKLNDTTLQVKASAADQAGIAITNPAGSALGFRYNVADVTGAVPGGLAAGDHDVYVIGSANAFGANPAPPPAELDNTVKTFGLKLLAAGATPSGSGTEAYYRKVATFYWDGAKITEVRPLVGQGVQKHGVTHGPGGRDELDWVAIQNSVMPAGVIVQYGGSAAPSGWLLCNGAPFDPVAYPELAAALGTTYGGTAGAPLLPDFRGVVPVGRDAAQAEFDTLGEKGGFKTTQLAPNQMPLHDHGGQTGGGVTTASATPAGSTVASGTGVDSPDHSHGGTTNGQSVQHTHNVGANHLTTFNYSGSPGNNGLTGLVNSGGGTQAAVSTGYSADHSHSFGTGGASARHAHTIPALTVNAMTIPALTVSPLSISPSGSASPTPVNLLQPYIVTNYIVKT